VDALFPQLRLALYLAGGAAAGLAWYRTVGCSTGGCLITSSPWISAAYGALLGYLYAKP
jgi:hypothetical protein